VDQKRSEVSSAIPACLRHPLSATIDSVSKAATKQEYADQSGDAPALKTSRKHVQDKSCTSTTMPQIDRRYKRPPAIVTSGNEYATLASKNDRCDSESSPSPHSVSGSLAKHPVSRQTTMESISGSLGYQTKGSRNPTMETLTHAELELLKAIVGTDSGRWHSEAESTNGFSEGGTPKPRSLASPRSPRPRVQWTPSADMKLSPSGPKRSVTRPHSLSSQSSLPCTPSLPKKYATYSEGLCNLVVLDEVPGAPRKLCTEPESFLLSPSVAGSRRASRSPRSPHSLPAILGM
jgi:hypothetical protein